LFQQGALPFRDFFEHHMPGIYYLLNPVMRAYDAAHRIDAVFAVITVARTVMWAFALATIALTVLLGRTWSKDVGWVAGALLSVCIVFVGRTLEIRPDVPAVALWTASSWALVMGVRRDAGSCRPWWAIAGACFGGTLLFTQKALLAGPGFTAFAIVYLFASQKARPVVAKFVDLVIFGTCACAALLVTVIHYWAQGALTTLVNGVLVNNLGWIQETTAASTLHWMLLRDPLLCALATGGAVLAVFDLIRDSERRAEHAAVFLPAASLMAGLAIIPAPFPQYLLLVLPAASVYAADLICSSLSPARSESAMEQILAITVFAVVAVVALAVARPYFRTIAAYPLLGIIVIGLVALFVRRGEAGFATVAVVVGVSVLSAQQLLWMHGLSNREALDEMRFIHGATSVDDTIMDGFTGVGWFRPHASYYWFTTPAVQAKLALRERAGIAAMLRDCTSEPRVVILDQYLEQLSSTVRSDVVQRYLPTPYSSIWLRDKTNADCGRATSPR